MKTVFYTFRTNKDIDQFFSLAKISNQNLFVIDKPSIDIPRLLNLISGADWVIGFAATTRSKSYWGLKAINKFNKSGRVSKNFDYMHELKLRRPDFLGDTSTISFRSVMGASFCNQAAFRVREFIERENLNISSGFLHLKA